jgi:hypothetical protein
MRCSCSVNALDERKRLGGDDKKERTVVGKGWLLEERAILSEAKVVFATGTFSFES